MLGRQASLLQRIYAAARRVGWGHTTTYGSLAKELGAGPEAARDVGQAMAAASGSLPTLDIRNPDIFRLKKGQF